MEKVFSELLKDMSSREVRDLISLIRVMVNDVARGDIDEDGVRRFFVRNKRFLQHILDNYASKEITVEEFIDKIVDAIMMDVVLAPGKSIVQIYLMRQRKEKEEKKENKFEVL